MDFPNSNGVRDCHFAVGDEVYHKDQLAVVMEHIGAVYEPLEPKNGDIVASYEIYQMKDLLILTIPSDAMKPQPKA